jgi:hypothetical protein
MPPVKVSRSMTSKLASQVVDQVALVNAVLLALVEEAADEAQPLLLRRREPDLVRMPAVAVLPVDELCRIDREALGGVQEVGPALVVEVRVIRVIRNRDVVSHEIGASVGHVEVGDLALDGERGLKPAVAAALGLEAGLVASPDARVVAEASVALGELTHHRRRHGPAVGQLNA